MRVYEWMSNYWGGEGPLGPGEGPRADNIYAAITVPPYHRVVRVKMLWRAWFTGFLQGPGPPDPGDLSSLWLTPLAWYSEIHKDAGTTSFGSMYEDTGVSDTMINQQPFIRTTDLTWLESRVRVQHILRAPVANFKRSDGSRTHELPEMTYQARVHINGSSMEHDGMVDGTWMWYSFAMNFRVLTEHD